MIFFYVMPESDLMIACSTTLNTDIKLMAEDKENTFPYFHIIQTGKINLIPNYNRREDQTLADI